MRMTDDASVFCASLFALSELGSCALAEQSEQSSTEDVPNVPKILEKRHAPAEDSEWQKVKEVPELAVKIKE